MFTRWHPRIWLAALAVAFVSLAAAFLGEPFVYGQGGDTGHVDVAVTLNVPETTGPHDLNVIVSNHGSRTAYDVEVVVNIVRPENSSFFQTESLAKLPVGSARLENDGYTFRWWIPALGGLQREEFTLRVDSEVFASDMLGFTFDKTQYPHEFFGKVTTSSFQSALHEGNDESRAWSYEFLVVGKSWRQAGGNYSLAVSVDELSPSPGDTINFTITTEKGRVIISRNEITGTVSHEIGWPTPPIDLKVDIELTDGLSVTGTPNYFPSGDDKPDSMIYSNHVFNIGTVKVDDLVISDGRSRYSVTLPIKVRDDAVVNGQCLTATLTGNPPPGLGYRDDDISDNEAKLCLSVGPPDRTLVFNSGEIGLLTWYNCVGRTTYPCSATDSVEFVSLVRSAAADAAQAGQVFKPAKVVIQVPDPFGRATSSEDGSSDPVWSTGYDLRPVIRPGVILTEEMVSLDPSQWGFDVDMDDTRAATLNMNVSGPGNMATWAADGDNSDPYEWFGSATNGELTSGTWYVDPGSFPWYAEFSELGTYRVDFDGAIAENNETPTNAADDTSYTIDERTYVFHVGPVADLEVSAAVTGESADGLEATLTAANNGPDHAIGPEVRLTLPAGVSVAQATPAGAAGGTFNRSTNTWKLDDDRRIVLRDLSGNEQRGMCPREYCLGVYGDEASTLTLLLKIDPARADIGTLILSGEIVNAGKYVARDNMAWVNLHADRPCLKKEPDKAASGSNCHTTNVYDPQPDNSSFRLELRKPVAPATEPRRISRGELHRAQLCSGWLPSRGDGYTSVGGENQHLQVEWYSNPHTLRYCMGDKGWHWMPLAWFQAQGVDYREGVEYRFSLDEAKSLRVEFMDTGYNYHQYRRTGQLVGPRDVILYRLSGETRAGTIDQIYQYQKELGVRIDPEETTDIGTLLGPRVVVNRCLGPGDYRLRVQPWESGSDNAGFERTVHHVARFSWTTAEGADCPAGVVVGQDGPTGQAGGEAQQLQANRAPEFRDGTSTTREVAENSPAGTNVGSPVAATDLDEGDTLTYFLSGDDAASFEIDRNTGQITTTSDVTYDYETQSSYSLLVDVSDGNGAWDGIQVTVDLTDVDETTAEIPAEPVFKTPPVDRTATVGTAFSYTPAAATDGQGDTITYAATLTGGSPLPGWLSFTPSTLAFAGTPQVCDGPAALPITITATDDSVPTPQTGAASFTLTVNAADGGPAWHETVSKADYLHYAAENNAEAPFDQWYNRPPLALTGAGATLILGLTRGKLTFTPAETVRACDADGDPLHYIALEGTDAAAFDLDENTGQLTTKAGHTYDHGTKSSYELTLIVQEPSTPNGYLAETSVTVNLTTDVANVTGPSVPDVTGDVAPANRAPAFPDDVATALALDENSPAGTDVGDPVTATDPDEGDTLTYSLSGTGVTSFEISGSTGQITTKSDVTYDFESKSSYSLVVTAADGKGGTDSTPVTVNLTNVNEAPSFADDVDTTLEVDENSAAGTNVGAAITATDPDEGDTVTYSLSGTDAASLDIGSSTGQIATKTGVTYNYEAKASYSLTVVASDAGGLTDSVDVTVSLNNVAEAPTVSDATQFKNHAATVGESFSLVLPAADANSGDGGPYEYLLWHRGEGKNFAGQAINGLSFNATTRTLSGTPDAAGVWQLSYVVHDDDTDRSVADRFRAKTNLQITVSE